ncbi:MAG: 2-vinyl bacteriochlorophyllide hydratase [Chloroflexales bacterium]|nr:2-vinyl bacteriochlorophyllide hydratase [Chloroflexales bacterium]
MGIYTHEQLARRNASPWTRVQFILAPIQFIVFIISFILVVRYLLTNQGYLAATISVWIKIALIWALTITGMLWEKDVYGHYFMAREFFWEDMGNLIAIITHNAYFVAQWLQFDNRTAMMVMLFAYITYLFNAVQFIVKGIRSGRERRAMAAADLPIVGAQQ